MGVMQAMPVSYIVRYYDSDIDETCDYKLDGFTQMAEIWKDIREEAEKTLKAEEEGWKRRGAGFSIGDVEYGEPYIINEGMREG